MKKPIIVLHLLLVVVAPVTTTTAFTGNVLPSRMRHRSSPFPLDPSWLQHPQQHKRSFHRYHHTPLYYSSASEISSLITSRSPYIRWKSSSSGGADSDAASLWEMQTAVTTFERRQEHDKHTGDFTTQRVELHAQLHFGDEAYFDYYKTPEFNENRMVLYELLLDEELLTTPYNDDDDSNDESNYRVLKRPSISSEASPVVLTASVQDESTARQYGWACQVNAISDACYTRPNWIHADLTRQEFLQKVTAAAVQEGQQTESSNKDTPLWQVAAQRQGQQSSPLFGRMMIPQSAAATEAATALLVGPPVLAPDAQGVRRLFSNLFLPGTALVQGLRALLWLTVPSPEISVLLLDWSSVVVDNDKRDGASSKGSGGLSPISWPLLQALGRGRLDQVRRLIFGQVVLQGATTQQTTASSKSSQDWTLLIQERNNHAMQVLRDTLRDDDDVSPSKSKVLLYGCSHCTDLHDQIVQEGFQPVKKEWRTAWSVPIGMGSPLSSTKGTEEEEATSVPSPTNSNSSSSSLMVIWILLPAYFVIGGLDWIATLQDMAQSADKADGIGVMADALLYLVRHVLLYLGLSKFVLDWGGTTAMATTSSTADTDDA